MARRLSLEPIEIRHADAVQQLASHPKIVDMTKLPKPYPEDGAIRWIEDAVAQRRASLGFAYAIMDGETLVGVTGLNSVSNGCAELGYWIGKPYWNRGFATEANEIILRLAFETHDLQRVEAYPFDYNGASCRVLEKIGFRNGGIATHPHPSCSDDDPLIRYVMTRERWQSIYVSEPAEADATANDAEDRDASADGTAAPEAPVEASTSD